MGVKLVPVLAAHAERLYALIKDSSITDTIRWDGPQSLAELRRELADRERQTARGEMHALTVIDIDTGEPIGSAHFREDPAEIGLWIGEPFQNKGIGTQVVADLTRYGFEQFPIDTIRAEIFVGNAASRRVFEKCGYTLERVAPGAIVKRGKTLDVWVMALTRENYGRK